MSNPHVTISEETARSIGEPFLHKCSIVVHVHAGGSANGVLNRFVFLNYEKVGSMFRAFRELDTDALLKAWIAAGAPMIWDLCCEEPAPPFSC